MALPFLSSLRNIIGPSYYNKLVFPGIKYDKSPDLRYTALRLDGAPMYKASMRNLYYLHFKYERSPSLIPNHPTTNYLSSTFNRYLARHTLTTISQVNKIVFQSHISRFMHESLLSVDFSNHQCTVIPNGVSPRLFTCSRTKSLQVATNFVCVANPFRAPKRLRAILNLVDAVTMFISQPVLHIVGYLPQEILKSLSLNTRKFKIVFHNSVAHQDLPQLLAKMHIMLHLSSFEACPNSVIEGLMCGLPVVCPTNTGTAELISKYAPHWAVNENLKMNFIDLDPKVSPFSNISDYVSTVLHILDDYSANSTLAHSIAIKEYDIHQIAAKYISFLDS